MTKKQSLKSLLKKKKFKAWLETLEPEEEVGINKVPCDCPVAIYIKCNGAELFDEGQDVYILSHSITIHSPKTYCEFPWKPAIVIPSPRWATRFIDNIDRRAVRSISADTALQALDIRH